MTSIQSSYNYPTVVEPNSSQIITSQSRIAQSRWNVQDIEFLEKMAKEHNYNWQKISQLFHEKGIVHAAYLCKNKYHDRFNPVLKCGKWTPEEDKKLKEIIERLGSNLQWPLVAEEMKSRTTTSCYHRWIKHLDTTLWSEQEEKAFKKAEEEYQSFHSHNKWEKISQKVGTKTPTQCSHYSIRLKYQAQLKSKKRPLEETQENTQAPLQKKQCLMNISALLNEDNISTIFLVAQEDLKTFKKK